MNLILDEFNEYYSKLVDYIVISGKMLVLRET